MKSIRKVYFCFLLNSRACHETTSSSKGVWVTSAGACQIEGGFFTILMLSKVSFAVCFFSKTHSIVSYTDVSSATSDIYTSAQGQSRLPEETKYFLFALLSQTDSASNAVPAIGRLRCVSQEATESPGTNRCLKLYCRGVTSRACGKILSSGCLF